MSGGGVGCAGLALTILLAVFYGFGAFVAGAANPMDWHWALRLILGLLFIPVAAFGAIFAAAVAEA